MIHQSNLTSSAIFVLVLLMPLAKGKASDSPNKKEEGETPFLEVRLRDLGYQPTKEDRHPGTGIPRDLSILNDDSKKRLAYISDKVLAIYFSHLPAIDHRSELESRSMEALFVNPSTGSLISRRTWATHKRKWVNDRWDTQARIMALRDGFLVQAANSLTLYSTDQQEKAKIPLEETSRWSAVVSVLGRTVHLQRINEDDSAEGQWLTSDTLKQLVTQQEVAGITSASDHAVVTKLARCVQLQSVGGHHVTCVALTHAD